MSTTPKDANELQRDQVERLIESTADLQKQILRRFANAAIEELRYHYRVEHTKNNELERENSDLRHDLTRAQSANTELATENADLKAKLATAREAIIEMDRLACMRRVGGGMDWSWDSPHAKRAHETARKAMEVIDLAMKESRNV